MMLLDFNFRHVFYCLFLYVGRNVMKIIHHHEIIWGILSQWFRL